MMVATPTMTVRDVPVHEGRLLASAQPAFDMVAFHWRGSGRVQYRVRVASGWRGWRTADADGAVQRGWHLGNLDWVGRATALQTRVSGRVMRVRSYTVWSPVEQTPARRLEIANAPPIIPRLSWGADESIRRAAPQYAPALKLAFVHHTAGSNDYTAAESAAIVRGIEIYHVKGNGWNDIGYNFLVDKYGQVFEGRYGGVDRNVIGAHVEGFNTGSVGVAVIGDYTSQKIPAAAAASLEQLLAWRLDLAHVDPLSTVTYASGGNSRFPGGTPVLLRAVSGHRDAYFSDCPGNALYAQLPSIAKAVAALGGPKIYAPQAAKTDETHTRITARLSAPQPWTVTVTNSAGAQVAQGAGTGSAVDWTWDATLAPPDRYTWTIASGTARPASGTVGGTTALALTKTSALPQVVGPGDTTTISYTLTAAATVTSALVDQSGKTISTLITVQKRAGSQTLAFSPPAGLPNGFYAIVLTAVSGGRAVTASVPFVVDDIVTGFTSTTSAVAFTLLRPAAAVTLQVLDGVTLVTALSAATTEGPQTLPLPSLPDGVYTIALGITDDVGTFTKTTTLTVDTVAPTVTVLSYGAMRFRVSEAAALSLTVGRRTFRRVLPRAATTQFWLKAKPTAYRLVVVDPSGNRTVVRYRR